MLLKRETLTGIADGSITVVFRRWRRATVKVGGTLLTPIGQLAVEAVDVVRLEEVSEAEAVAAGFADLESLRTQLSKRAAGDVYRIQLSLSGPDPRIGLRAQIPSEAELDRLRQRLSRLDSSSGAGPWTYQVLSLIRARPAERAADLARELGMDKASFKANVRKLKGLGLTESLKVGYQLSPRGVAVVAQLRDHRTASQ